MPTGLPGSAYSAYAFEVLYSRLTQLSSEIPLSKFEKLYHFTSSNEPHPLFVTWNTVCANEKELRGCIGTFSPLNVDEGIKEYSYIAALEDPRFDPVELDELPQLSCDVTLLKDFEKVDDIWDWQVGKHGIRISFVDSNCRKSATFLPEVASEQKWDQKTTMSHLIRKAGGPYVTDFESMGIILTRYKGEKSHITYDEFMKVRKEVQIL